jgi:hypothetical protein
MDQRVIGLELARRLKGSGSPIRSNPFDPNSASAGKVALITDYEDPDSA